MGTMLVSVRESARKFFTWAIRPEILIGLILSSFLINCLSLIFPLVMLQVYDRIIPNAAYATLELLAIGVGIALLLEMALRIGRAVINSWLDVKFEFQLATKAFASLLTTSIDDYQKEGAGAHLERLNSLSALKDFYGGQALATLLDLPFMFLFLGLIAYLGGSLILVSFLSLALTAALAYITGLKIQAMLALRKRDDDQRMNFIIEILTGIHTVKSMAMEPLMLRRYERLQRNSATKDYKLAVLSDTAFSLGSLISQLNIILIVAMGSFNVINGKLTVGALAACTLLASRSLQPLNQVMMFWKRLQAINIAKQRLNAINTLPQETQFQHAESLAIQGEIEFKNINIADPNQEGKLEKFNLTIKARQTVALLEDKYQEATLLFNMLLGNCQDYQGELSIDGQDILSYDIGQLRQRIAYLPQQGTLFEGTIMDNLTLFQGDKYVQRAREITMMLGIDTAIAQLPQGFDTQVGQRSVETLTPGLRQRIVIARALLREPAIILFDNAEHGIDMRAKQDLQKVLKAMAGTCTLVMSTADPGLLTLADITYTIKDKKLVQS